MVFKRIIKSSTADQIKNLLRSVILETKYTGPNAKIEGYELGGKTGTAELLSNGNYSSDSNLASFISIFPVSNPRSTTGGLVILKGNLAPEGAVIIYKLFDILCMLIHFFNVTF